MTDRELLELAAKAADLKVDFNEWLDHGRCLMYRNKTENDWWNPLFEDGDALRLVVKLRMDVTFDVLDVFAFPADGSEGASATINVDDPYAATRRAIVRAAAEIGKELK